MGRSGFAGTVERIGGKSMRNGEPLIFANAASTATTIGYCVFEYEEDGA